MKPLKFDICVVVIFLFTNSCASNNPPSQSEFSPDTQDYCRSIGRALGRCVPLQDCTVFSSWIQARPVLKENIKTVIKFTCYFDLQKPKVLAKLYQNTCFIQFNTFWLFVTGMLSTFRNRKKG